MSDENIRQIAFYGKGGIGKSTTSVSQCQLDDDTKHADIIGQPAKATK
ncbi:MAG: hypothetical protein HC903_06400 [Methylacidiphilales bacterium]|nr:hypothetical protein [Candidatus Methylacidiphilales bacterium]NJR18043.1 hypothetical protein [Calothrix sp. CSU_2_0]